MKYHMVFKFLAVLLCACCLLVSIGAGIGIFALVESGLYETTVEELRLEQQAYRFSRAVDQIARVYVLETLCDLPENAARVLLDENYGGYYYLESIDRWYYTLEDEAGTVLSQRIEPELLKDAQAYSEWTSTTYPVVLGHRLIDPLTSESDTTDATREPTMPQTTTPGSVEMEATVPTYSQDYFIDGTVMPAEEGSEYLHYENWAYEDKTGIHQYRLGILQSPQYKVTLYLTPDVYEGENLWVWELAEFGYTHRYNVIWVLGGSLLLFAVLLVYLCCAAGRRPKSEEVCPGGLNRLPLDLYAVCAGFALVLLAAGGYELIPWRLDYYDPQWLLVLAVGVMAFVACLLVVAFLFACAAQFKMKKCYWARNSLTGMLLVAACKLARWILRKLGSGLGWLKGKLPAGCQKLFGAIKKLCRILIEVISFLWGLLCKAVKAVFSFLKKVLLGIWNGIRRFCLMIPLTWQWLLVGLLAIFVLLIGFSTRIPGVQFWGIAFCICVVMYGAHCFGVLLESTKRMSKGDLDTKVDDKLLLGSFQEYATHLNALADVAVEAAKNQMKSERMKAELVTNVSHDIKTPLTSIINYVDLLQKAESQEQAEEYLEVLDRQSQRLKKLIEDLMEMSKASTGNMTVNLMHVNAVETINQALGEFSEKLEKAQLTPVFNPPEEPVMMTADGRLTWRVLSNLLGNAVKYALPGTRLYIDLVAVNGQVLISLKNISKEQLNVRTEELMERFVRGDASRNTEGSGLGLNIAKSLMELQKGQLQLLVDGDLFKATLIFPCS